MKRAYGKYIAGLLLFGLNGIVSSKILLSSYDIVFFRTLFGGLFLSLLCLLSMEKRRFTDFPKQFAAVILSGISMGLSWIFLYKAYQRIGVALSSVTYYCGPVIVMLLTPSHFHKKITRRQIFCFVIVFAGILFVSVPDLTGSTAMDSLGLFYGFASAVVHALMVIFTMKAPDLTRLKNAAIQLVVSFLTVAVFVLAGHPLTMPAGSSQWFWILFLGIVNTGIGCYLYFSDIAKLPITSVSILGYLEPLSAVVFSFLLLHESFSLPETLGAALILAGALLSEWTGTCRN